MESKELFFYELEGRGYIFQNKTWNESKHGFEDDMLNMAWEMWSSTKSQKVALPEWISLEDVEPNIGETVLICWSDGFDVEPEKDFMDVDIDSGVHYWSNFENDEPTHWMPIPQPPKAQEQVG